MANQQFILQNCERSCKCTNNNKQNDLHSNAHDKQLKTEINVQILHSSFQYLLADIKIKVFFLHKKAHVGFCSTETYPIIPLSVSYLSKKISRFLYGSCPLYFIFIICCHKHLYLQKQRQMGEHRSYVIRSVASTNILIIRQHRLFIKISVVTTLVRARNPY